MDIRAFEVMISFDQGAQAHAIFFKLRTVIPAPFLLDNDSCVSGEDLSLLGVYCKMATETHPFQWFEDGVK
jgi:hypothetical protein